MINDLQINGVQHVAAPPGCRYKRQFVYTGIIIGIRWKLITQMCRGLARKQDARLESEVELDVLIHLVQNKASGENV